MTVYAAMLRGINVGGTKKVPMKDLASVVAGVGVAHVRTYIQSGNVVFSSSASAPELTDSLESAIAAAFGFSVPVQLRNKRQLSAVVDRNPFLKVPADPKTLHVTFLDAKPSAASVNSVQAKSFASDAFELSGHEVFLCCPKGYGNTKLHNTFWEKQLSVGATTRNWKTVLTLLEMCDA